VWSVHFNRKMSDCTAPEIAEAYEDVRNDRTETNWMLITYADGSDNVWTLVGKGEGGLDELKQNLSDDFRGFGYIRVISGDELSRRPKFVLIRYVGKSVSQFKKTKLTVHGGDVMRVLSQYAVSVDADSIDELTIEDIMDRVQKAGGAHYTRQE